MLKSISTKTLLTLGIIAGPMWVIVAFIQAFTRPGFDLVRHPASLLAQGDLGWIQIADFVLAGVLFIASAAGLKRVLARGAGATWAPITLGVFGAGLIIGGVFRADPALGFPPGAPPGVPETISLSSQIHGFAPMIAFISLTIFFFIMARYFFKEKKRSLGWATIVIALTSFVLSNIPNITADWEAGIFNFIPLWIGASISLLWVSILLAVIRKTYKSTREEVRI